MDPLTWFSCLIHCLPPSLPLSFLTSIFATWVQNYIKCPGYHYEILNLILKVNNNRIIWQIPDCPFLNPPPSCLPLPIPPLRVIIRSVSIPAFLLGAESQIHRSSSLGQPSYFNDKPWALHPEGPRFYSWHSLIRFGKRKIFIWNPGEHLPVSLNNTGSYCPIVWLPYKGASRVSNLPITLWNKLGWGQQNGSGFPGSIMAK